MKDNEFEKVAQDILHAILKKLARELNENGGMSDFKEFKEVIISHLRTAHSEGVAKGIEASFNAYENGRMDREAILKLKL